MAKFSIGKRLKHMWNAFSNTQDSYPMSYEGGVSSYGRSDRVRLRFSNERSIISSILTRISLDVAAIDLRHVRLDSENRFLEEIDSSLNNCLSVEANLDQASGHFKQDAVLTMLDKGLVAIVPVDTTTSPIFSGGFDIKTMRNGEIVNWYPEHVRVNLYNQARGLREDITLPKSMVAIVENPLYTVLNEPNSTLQRLIRKLNLLDAIDEQSGSGKLDLIIQLPYVIKSEARRQQAEQRRKDIEFQLAGSKYGIAYTDGTERVTQLNRPAENNLLKQVEFLTAMLYTQLGLTDAVMNGTADTATMNNYYNRTIWPIVNAIVEAMRRSFLTRTARSQKQSIMAFRDPFKAVPITDLAEIADKLARNEIVTSNEIRQAIGMRPAKDPNADKLRNSNMPQPNDPNAKQSEPVNDLKKPKADPNQEDLEDHQNGT
jgi:hypothetical protein